MKTCQLTCHFIPFFEGSDVSYPFSVFRTLAGTISYLMSTYFIPSCFHTHYDKVSYHPLHSYIHPRTSHIHNFILVALEFHTRTLVHTVNTSHLYLLLLHTCSSSYMFLLKFILTLHFLLLNVFIIHKHNSYQ